MSLADSVVLDIQQFQSEEKLLKIIILHTLFNADIVLSTVAFSYFLLENKTV